MMNRRIIIFHNDPNKSPIIVTDPNYKFMPKLKTGLKNEQYFVLKAVGRDGNNITALIYNHHYQSSNKPIVIVQR